MRICRVLKHLPSSGANPGGLHAWYFTRYMPEPTLLIAKADGERWLPLPPHARIVAIPYRDVPFKERVGEPPATGMFARFARSLRLAARLVAKGTELAFLVRAVRPLCDFRPDLVHAHGVVTLLPALFAKRWLGARLVVTIHSATDVGYARRSRLVRAALRRADRIVCVAPELRDGLASVVPSHKLTVIPSAFEPERFQPGPPTRKRQLVAVGYLKPQKGYGYLLDAMAIVVKRFPDHELVIAGDGPERVAMERHIVRLGLAGHVRLLGAIDQDAVAARLAESRVFVMASLSEGLPKAALESLACGTPVVATTACHLGGLIDDAGIVVTPRDPGALARAIEALLSDETLWQRCSAAAPRAVAQYDWRSVADRMARVYRELVPAA